MYNEYKSKGLVPDDFPELTIVQMRDNIENFVKNTLESFTKANLDPLSNIDEYQTYLNDYEKDVFLYLSGGKGSWFDKYMDRTNFLILKDGTKVYTYKKEFYKVNQYRIGKYLKHENNNQLKEIVNICNWIKLK